MVKWVEMRLVLDSLGLWVWVAFVSAMWEWCLILEVGRLIVYDIMVFSDDLNISNNACLPVKLNNREYSP